MRKKKLGLLWATIGLVVGLGILGIAAKWDTLAWMFYAAVSVVVTTAAFITSRQKIRSDAHPNAHNPMLWDLSPYTCKHGVNPSSSTTQCAWPMDHDLKKWPNEPTDEERREKVYKPRQSER